MSDDPLCDCKHPASRHSYSAEFGCDQCECDDTFPEVHLYSVRQQLERYRKALEPFAKKYEKHRYSQNYYRVPTEVMEQAAQALRDTEGKMR